VVVTPRALAASPIESSFFMAANIRRNIHIYKKLLYILYV